MLVNLRLRLGVLRCLFEEEGEVPARPPNGRQQRVLSCAPTSSSSLLCSSWSSCAHPSSSRRHVRSLSGRPPFAPPSFPSSVFAASSHLTRILNGLPIGGYYAYCCIASSLHSKSCHTWTALLNVFPSRTRTKVEYVLTRPGLLCLTSSYPGGNSAPPLLPVRPVAGRLRLPSVLLLLLLRTSSCSSKY